MEYYIFQMEINMKENGKMEYMKVMEYILVQILINMKENGKMV